MKYKTEDFVKAIAELSITELECLDGNFTDVVNIHANILFKVKNPPTPISDRTERFYEDKQRQEFVGLCFLLAYVYEIAFTFPVANEYTIAARFVGHDVMDYMSDIPRRPGMTEKVRSILFGYFGEKEKFDIIEAKVLVKSRIMTLKMEKA